jgi:hypothetical protein
MKRFLQSGIVIFAGVLGIATASVQPEQDVTKVRRKFDLREALLRKFLKNNHCPVEEYAPTFLTEADTNGLDWRLLPSISLVESGGGRTAKGNNLFGWANGKHTFASVGEAIHLVASALAHGRAYSGKDLRGKLAAYNQGTNYQAMVLDIMRQISPTVQVEAAAE